PLLAPDLAGRLRRERHGAGRPGLHLPDVPRLHGGVCHRERTRIQPTSLHGSTTPTGTRHDHHLHLRGARDRRPLFHRARIDAPELRAARTGADWWTVHGLPHLLHFLSASPAEDYP